MHRFFVGSDSLQNDVLNFAPSQARQIRDVLHLRAGEEVIALDNGGMEYRVVLSKIARDGVSGQVLERALSSTEPRMHLVLFQGLLKSDKFEWVLQKGTELGISEFVPMLTARVVANSVSAKKMERWRQIVREAAEQSGRGKLPQINSLITFEQAISSAERAGGLVLIPWEEERSLDLRTALDSDSRNPAYLFIGPEGGFTPDEIERARKAQARVVTLGPRILRAETAGLVAASAIFFARGELNAL